MIMQMKAKMYNGFNTGFGFEHSVANFCQQLAAKVQVMFYNFFNEKVLNRKYKQMKLETK